jgi:S-adenosylmethionine hydrolase
MPDRPIITLTTDFGLKDPFVGIMKGVILGINPDAVIIDISHGISPQNIFEASQILAMSYKYFPPSTVHVAVVDPGVGGTRRPLLVSSGDHAFIGPDNGIFTAVLEQEKDAISHIIHISSHNYFLPVKGPTFHGRDIFAPVAAWISKGVEKKEFGREIKDYVTLALPEPLLGDDKTLTGEIVYIDSFGNAVTNISCILLTTFGHDIPPESLKVLYRNQQLGIARSYQEKKDSDLAALFNSFDFLELFLYGGDAAKRFGIQTGEKVTITYES